MDLENRTKDEKEELVRLKMESMKKKNEEILRRHLEIEADKQNADIHSKAVIEKQKKNPTSHMPRERTHPPNYGQRKERQQNVPKTNLAAAAPTELDEKRKQRLCEIGSPPPDPNFNFLSDPSRERDECETESPESKDKSRRHKNNYGGEDFQNVKTAIKQQRNYAKEHPLSPPKSKMEMSLRMTGRERKEYDNWRQEREKVDKERIARHKTPEGTFKREWDNQKIKQDEDESMRKPNEYYRSPQRNMESDSSVYGRRRSERNSQSSNTDPEDVPQNNPNDGQLSPKSLQTNECDPVRKDYSRGRGRGMRRPEKNISSSNFDAEDYSHNQPLGGQPRSQKTEFNEASLNWKAIERTDETVKPFKNISSNQQKPKVGPRGRFSQFKRDEGQKELKDLRDSALDDTWADDDEKVIFCPMEMSALKVQIVNEDSGWNHNWQGSPNGTSFSDSWSVAENRKVIPRRIVTTDTKLHEKVDENCARENSVPIEQRKEGFEDNENEWEDVSGDEDDFEDIVAAISPKNDAIATTKNPSVPKMKAKFFKKISIEK